MTEPWIVAYGVLFGLVVLLALLMLGLLRKILPLLDAERAAASEQPAFGAEVGSAVDRFPLYTNTGSRIKWEDFLQAPSLLVLTGQGCRPCDELIPKLEGLDNEIEGVPLLFVVDGPPDGGELDLDTDWPVLYDRDSAAVKALHNKALPQAYVLAPSGHVLARRIPHSAQDLRRMVLAREVALAGAG
jgi:hypothetical protein